MLWDVRRVTHAFDAQQAAAQPAAAPTALAVGGAGRLARSGTHAVRRTRGWVRRGTQLKGRPYALLMLLQLPDLDLEHPHALLGDLVRFCAALDLQPHLRRPKLSRLRYIGTSILRRPHPA